MIILPDQYFMKLLFVVIFFLFGCGSNQDSFDKSDLPGVWKEITLKEIYLNDSIEPVSFIYDTLITLYHFHSDLNQITLLMDDTTMRMDINWVKGNEFKVLRLVNGSDTIQPVFDKTTTIEHVNDKILVMSTPVYRDILVYDTLRRVNKRSF